MTAEDQAALREDLRARPDEADVLLLAAYLHFLAGEYGVGSVVFDPCGNRPESGDYIAVMRANVERLEALPAI